VKIKIQCPAKVNLTLKIVGKRPDGFHNIESIMQTIDLYDYLTIEVKQSENFEIILSGNNPEIPYNEKNLVYKAAKLFFDTIFDKNGIFRLQRHSEHSEESVQNSPQNNKNYKISIYIEKHIPVAAGLAGGSTDAAGTLYGLNEIFNRPLDKKQLHELCAKLGSDLNVCLEGGRLMTRGRGEIIEPMPFEEFNLSLIKPKNLGISAKEAYTKFSEKNNKCHSGPTCKQILRYAQNDIFRNDLEWAIIDDYKELQKIKELYPNSMMSGSGSTYFEIDGNFKPLEGYEIYNNHKAVNFGTKKVPLD
jgi:4-diphosphocytidyl-2-C-methyl-D-erythritol kinase